MAHYKKQIFLDIAVLPGETYDHQYTEDFSILGDLTSDTTINIPFTGNATPDTTSFNITMYKSTNTSELTGTWGSVNIYDNGTTSILTIVIAANQLKDSYQNTDKTINIIITFDVYRDI